MLKGVVGHCPPLLIYFESRFMSPIFQQLGIDRLSQEERLKLISEIWESLDPIDQTEIPESHRQELDSRLANADADPSAGKPWEEVRMRLREEK